VKRSLRWRLIALGAAAPVLPFLLWSCNPHTLQKPEPNPVSELAQYREINPIHKVDIVFVVDNSGSMSEEQGNLSRNFPIFMNELNVPGADLQIAVVSSDLGGGAGSAQSGCNTGGGDKGLFCTTRAGGGMGMAGAQVDKCAQCSVDVSGGRFLRTVNPNFPGGMAGIANTFTCMATLGTNGCGFEHSVGALTRALTNADNGNFVRDDAYLAFVLITDEDDCSAPPDSQMFATAIPGQDWSLRCALEAHTCGGAHNDGTVDVDRALTECQAASDGQLIPIKDLENIVLGVKKDPDQIIAAGIFGWPLPPNETTARYNIRAAGNFGGGERGMRPVCESRNGSATPGLRVKQFVESFPNHSTYSICQDNFSEAMRRIGEKIKVILGSPCVDAPLVDAKPETKDVLDPDCAVVERRPRGGGDYEEVILARCQPNDTKPCWDISPDQTCSVSKYKLTIDRKNEPVVEGTTQSIRCLTLAAK
jgi:hypothetical protein